MLAGRSENRCEIDINIGHTVVQCVRVLEFVPLAGSGHKCYLGDTHAVVVDKEFGVLEAYAFPVFLERLSLAILQRNSDVYRAKRRSNLKHLVGGIVGLEMKIVDTQTLGVFLKIIG